MNIEDLSRIIDNCLSSNNQMRKVNSNAWIKELKENKSYTLKSINQILINSTNDKSLFSLLFLKNNLKVINLFDIKEELVELLNTLIKKLQTEESMKLINTITDIISFLFLNFNKNEINFNIYNEFVTKLQNINSFKQSLILMKICEYNTDVINIFKNEIKNIFSEDLEVNHEISLYLEEKVNLFLNNIFFFKTNFEDLYNNFINLLFTKIFPFLNINEINKLYFYLEILNELIDLEVIEDKNKLIEIFNYLQNLDKTNNYYKIQNQIFDICLLLVEKNYDYFNNENVFLYLFNKIVELVKLNLENKDNNKPFKVDRLILEYVNDILKLLSDNNNLQIFSGFIINMYNKNSASDYYCSYLLLSQIGEYLDNFNDIKPIFHLIQKDYNNDNNYVRYALYLCLSQLSLDMKPSFQQEFYFQVIEIINDNFVNENEQLFPYLMKAINSFISGITLSNEFFKKNFDKIFGVIFDPLFDKLNKIKNVKILKYCYKFLLIFINMIQYNIISWDSLNEIFKKLIEYFQVHYNDNNIEICSLNLLTLSNLLYFSNEEYFNLYHQNIFNKLVYLLKECNYEIDKKTINLYNACNFLIPITSSFEASFIGNVYYKLNEKLSEIVEILKNKNLNNESIDYFVLEISIKLLESIIICQKENFINYVEPTLKNVLNFINLTHSKNARKTSVNIIINLIEVVDLSRKDIKFELCKFLFKLISTSIYLEFDEDLIGLKFKCLYNIVYKQQNFIDKDDFQYVYNIILKTVNKMNIFENNIIEEEIDQKVLEKKNNFENLDIIWNCIIELSKFNDYGDMFFLHFFYEYSQNILISNKTYSPQIFNFSLKILYYFLETYQFKNIKLSISDILDIIDRFSENSDINIKTIIIKILNTWITLIESNIFNYHEKIMEISDKIKNSNVNSNNQKDIIICSEWMVYGYGILLKELFKNINISPEAEIKPLINKWVDELPLKILKSESFNQNDLFINLSINYPQYILEDSSQFLLVYLKVFCKIFCSKNFSLGNEVYFNNIIITIKNYYSFNETFNLLEDYHKECILKLINQNNNSQNNNLIN